jgi:uncharacterized protein (TIGR00369 family)
MTVAVAPEIAELWGTMTHKNTLVETLGIEFLSVSPQKVAASMPVSPRTHQPFGLLHGGASVALAETLASVGAWLNVGVKGGTVVGLEINANHLRGIRSGNVIGTATPVHLGKSTHVWTIDIRDEQDRPVCLSRCTLVVLQGKP